WYPHAVVVDEPQLELVGRFAGNQKDIAMLKVGVRDLGVAQPFAQAHPHTKECLELLRSVRLLADELVEGESLDPFHLEDGIPLSADADPFRQEAKANREGQSGTTEVQIDLGVALAKTGDGPSETLDGPHSAVGSANLVDVGKVARSRQWQSQRAGDDL